MTSKGVYQGYNQRGGGQFYNRGHNPAYYNRRGWNHPQDYRNQERELMKYGMEDVNPLKPERREGDEESEEVGGRKRKRDN